jgi:hypothetical protein
VCRTRDSLLRQEYLCFVDRSMLPSSYEHIIARILAKGGRIRDG